MNPNHRDPLTPEQLSDSYEALAGAGQAAWDVDAMAPESSARAEPTKAPATEGGSAENAVPPSPARIIEALLFVGGEALTATRACEIVRGLTPGQFTDIIAALNAEYRRQARPYAVVAQDRGYVLTLRPRFRGIVDKLYGGMREARLSPAAIDVLALLAYRQPATKAEIDALRGFESGPLLRQLVRRGLAAVLRRAEADRRNVTYGTTRRFLELFGLTTLDDLPRTQDLQQI